jgi:hypothetical protein
MPPEVPIVDCGSFYTAGFLRTIDKSEFSHSLGRLPTCRKSAKSGHW